MASFYQEWDATPNIGPRPMEGCPCPSCTDRNRTRERSELEYARREIEYLRSELRREQMRRAVQEDLEKKKTAKKDMYLNRLTAEQKKILSEGDQALIEGGVISNDLQLADTKLVIEFLFQENREKVATYVAEKVADQKAKEKKEMQVEI